MADVFLSYRNLPDRRILVDRLAAILEANGLEVWWDYGLEAGAPYRDQILNELAEAKVVAPLWCAESVVSEWVQREAEFGKQKLMPARLQKVTPPGAFEAIQAADLIGWDGRVDYDPLERYIAGIAERAGIALKKRVSLLGQLRHLPPLAALPTISIAAAASGDGAARVFASIYQSRNPADFQRFIEAFPGTPEAFSAQTRLAAFDGAALFNTARANGTRHALQEFVRLHPHSDYARHARRIISGLPLVREKIALSTRNAKFSPDGLFVAEAIYIGKQAQLNDKTELVRIREVRSGRPIVSLRGLNAQIEGMVFSPNGRKLLTTSSDRTVCMWDASSGAKIAALREHKDLITALGFDAKGLVVLTAALDGTARVWDGQSKRHHALVKHRGGIFGASFSPDGQRVLTVGEDVRIWTQPFKKFHTLPANVVGAVVEGASFSPDGRLVLVSTKRQSPSRRLKDVWAMDAASGNKVWDIPSAEKASLSATGQMLVAIFPEGAPTIYYDMLTRTGTISGGRALFGHSDVVHAACFSPDGTSVLTASKDGTARLWDASTGQQLACLDHNVTSVNAADFAADGSHILTMGAFGAIVWEVDGSPISQTEANDET